jgi:CheY-like chemotaxis protein
MTRLDDRPRHILIVEDEVANRVLLRAILARAKEAMVRDALILEAGTLWAAREALQQHRLDLVVLDVRLPDGSGLALAREIMASGRERPRVLILSASVLAPDRDAAVIAGADAFMGKPYAPPDLVRAIHDLLLQAAA